MNRLAALALASSLVFVAAGCDDDDDLFKTDGAVAVDAPRLDAGGTDGGDAGGGPAACTGTFVGYNRAQLEARTSPTGKCAKASDLDLICTGDISEKIRGYGTGCITSGQSTEAALRTCITNAVNMNHTFTAGCLDCYIGSVACSFQKCNTQCVSDPSGMACRTCQVAQGCLTTFFTCAGIMPPSTGTDAGTDATDAGTDARDATTDVPRDGGADGPDGNPGGPDAVDSAPDAMAG